MALHAIMNAVIGVFRLYLFITSTFRRPEPRPELSPNPDFYQSRINNINRLVRGNDVDCHEQLRVNRSIETISRHFNAVLQAVLRLHRMLLVTPEPIPANYQDTRWNWFQNCLGALDGTYVPVNPPAVDRPRYRSRKGEISTNVLGVCTRDLKFVYVLSGWEGSATDSRILGNAMERPHGLRVPHGQYYLVDAGYTNGNGFLAPYRGQRYHINIWRQGHLPTSKEEFFNMKHSAARNCIERSFGVLKKRFAILRSPSFYPIRTQCRIVSACCLLHNLIKREMPNDPIEHEYTAWELAHINDVPVDDHIGAVESSNEWTAGRDALAAAMYNQWLANGGGQVEGILP
ncbi:uncharacterized protein LOC131327575 [Rhododendron vialii]|uniref:uncharacterized protein LOC131327575 n=2 Tax=Rhododendron vialii TaxID=182163 RepID=UPI00265D8B61|nr:uncharacterized protein LOC131327575 [Rhododendron vialii]